MTQMPNPNKSDIEIVVLSSDISQELIDEIQQAGIVAWDIETSGLNWNTDRIATCQLYIPSSYVAIIRVDASIPKKLLTILTDQSIKKVFHHAVFDLQFMAHHWQVDARNIACTKIASKLIDPNQRHNHGLQHLIKQYLGIELDKTEQLSNWFAKELSQAQLEYAANDVLYLIPLLEKLQEQLRERGMQSLTHRVYEHIPTRVQLDIHGFSDIYTY